jgi:hypothetical protein
MPPPDPSEEQSVPVPPGFAEELAEHFGDLAPQGAEEWNFADAFGRLRAMSEMPGVPGLGDEARAEMAARASSPEPPASGAARRAAGRLKAERLQPWVDELIREEAARIAAAAVGPVRERLDDSVDAVTEALRYLAARVEALEDAIAGHRRPVDGLFWLLPPVDLGDWVPAIVQHLEAASPPGEVLHAECGNGDLVVALAAAGLEARGAEPRGTLALAAAERGAAVRFADASEVLAATAPGTLGALVLSGVTDRLVLGELVGLVRRALGRLAPGARLVVTSTGPDPALAGRDAVARDLLPGRPLHPETWELLLARAGCAGISGLTLPGGGGGPSFAISARGPQ